MKNVLALMGTLIVLFLSACGDECLGPQNGCREIQSFGDTNTSSGGGTTFDSPLDPVSSNELRGTWVYTDEGTQCKDNYYFFSSTEWGVVSLDNYRRGVFNLTDDKLILRITHDSVLPDCTGTSANLLGTEFNYTVTFSRSEPDSDIDTVIFADNKSQFTLHKTSHTTPLGYLLGCSNCPF